MSQLGAALFTTTQQKVLGLLYGQPEKSFYTKQIIRITGMGVATIKRELDRMLAAGILSMTKIGNQHHYQADVKCPIYHELLAIVKKTFGVSGVLTQVLLPLRSKIKISFVYGSVAKGTEHSESDIDLMLVSDDLSYSEVLEVLSNAEKQLGRTINPTMYTQKEFIERIENNLNFITRVMEQPKLWIVGESKQGNYYGKVG